MSSNFQSSYTYTPPLSRLSTPPLGGSRTVNSAPAVIPFSSTASVTPSIPTMGAVMPMQAYEPPMNMQDMMNTIGQTMALLFTDMMALLGLAAMKQSNQLPNLGSASNNGFGNQGQDSSSNSGTTWAPSTGSAGSAGGSGPLTGTNKNAVHMKFVEVGQDNKPDQHTAEVEQVYNNNVGDRSSVTEDQPSILGANDGRGLPKGVVPMPNQIQTQNDLNTFIDHQTTYALGEMTQQVTNTQSGVLNASLGETRDSVYMDTISTLKQNPQLAQSMGLSSSDLSGIGTNQNGSIDPSTIPDNVKSAVVQYVDNRMDAPNSAYSQALQSYRDATQQAAQRNVMVVVAAGNDGKDRSVFTTGKPGQDSNFLMLSNNVISAAASDANGNIAAFSSSGDGTYNPTVAADGVNVQTSYGAVNGTSFSAPTVAATITQMLEANPNLTFDQVKAILQKTATQTSFDPTTDGAGLLNAQQAIAVATG